MTTSSTQNTPLVRLQSEGRASVINYQLPEPTTYRVQNVLPLMLPDEHFKSPLRMLQRATPSSTDRDTADMKRLIQDALSGKGSDVILRGRLLIPDSLATNAGVMHSTVATESNGLGARVSTTQPIVSTTVNPRLAVDVDRAAARIASGQMLLLKRTFSGRLSEIYVTPPTKAMPQVCLLLRYGLSTFLGEYGAGRVVGTFSLLPGESTTIAIKTYKTATTSTTVTSSTLESYSTEAATELETIISQENTSSQSYDASAAFSMETEAGMSVPIEAVKLSASTTTSFSTAFSMALDYTSRNTLNSTSSQAQSASSKREVSVNSTTSSTATSGEEQTITRNITNINVGRTLNFVFRQMNQEFYTLMHLTDVQIGFFNGDERQTKRVPLYQMDELLQEVMEPAHIEKARALLLRALREVRDHNGQIITDFVVPVTVSEFDGAPSKAWKVNPNLQQTFTVGDKSFSVSGTILGVEHNVMRTDGVIVEGLLGQADTLDDYSKSLQVEKVRDRELANERLLLENEKLRVALQIIQSKDATAAALYDQLFGGDCAAVQSPALTSTNL